MRLVSTGWPLQDGRCRIDRHRIGRYRISRYRTGRYRTGRYWRNKFDWWPKTACESTAKKGTWESSTRAGVLAVQCGQLRDGGRQNRGGRNGRQAKRESVTTCKHTLCIPMGCKSGSQARHLRRPRLETRGIISHDQP